MKATWTVLRAELRGYLDHPTAYVLVIAFVGLALFLSLRQMFISELATLRPLFDLLPWLFTVFVPAVTMRSLAEERRGGTLEWLLAQPVGEGELVIGKLLGNWLLVLLALAGTLPTAVAIVWATDADPGIVIGQYAGAALMAAELSAIGLWASSVTRNQITAFILGISVVLFLILLGMPVVALGLPPLLSGAASRLSVLGHFENVTRGVIDLRDFLYFASSTGLFTLLAYATVIRERLSATRSAYRRLQLGVVAVVAAVVVLNLLGGYVRGRLDLTRGNLYTLAPGTRQILEGLDDIVSIRFYVSKELPPEVQVSVRDVQDLLADLKRVSDGQVQVEEVNPDEDPEAAQQAQDLGITAIDFNVLREDEFQVRRGWFGLAISYAEQNESIPLIDRTDDLEFRLLSAVSHMATVERPTVRFLTGYGARGPDDFQAFSGMLAQRYDITALDLQREPNRVLTPDSTRVVIVAAPTQTLDSASVRLIRDYLDAGGAGLFLMDRNQITGEMMMAEDVTSGLDPLLEDHGVRVAPGIIYDLRSSERISNAQQGEFTLVQAYPYWPIVSTAGPHTTTRDLQQLSLGWANPVEVVEGSPAVPLWATTDAAGLQDAGSPVMPGLEDQFNTDSTSLEVRTVAVAVGPELADGAVDGEVEAPTTPPVGSQAARIVVVGDADFLSEQFVGAKPQNLYFAANAVDWLAQDEALISIRSKNRMPPPLVFPSDLERTAVRWGSLIGVPLLLALFGVIRVSGRRRRAERRWREMVA
ncbi:MAG: hypothetical protein EXR92_00675 [Gemmatimonadetes bacterium]|nr:hypothetical protein [Gemmatimonadota bacterium]